MSNEFEHWSGRPQPSRIVLEGQYVRLEPLDPARHGDGLFKASTVTDAAERFRYLGDTPPTNREAFQLWLEKMAQAADPLFFVVIDKATGRIGGRQALMRIDAANGVAEIGNVYWGEGISRTPLATEAFYLLAKYVFEGLAYRRFEWKCNDNNEPSKRAALRFGFAYEGLFRQHMIVKGENRDTAWFSMLDNEWPLIGAAIETWLSPQNFDREGRQLKSLQAIRETVVRS